jgi:hypothetical protein
MALISHGDTSCPSPSFVSQPHEESSEGDAFDLNNFEEELRRLSAVNQELMDEIHLFADPLHEPADANASFNENEEMTLLRLENAELQARIQELEAKSQSASGPGEDVWLERQREYEMLLEEKSEVIRSLHQKIQEMQESANFGDHAPPTAPTGNSQDIVRLKREMDEQRGLLKQDEEDVMGQLRQMELTMAKERAEMARQRQEMSRLQADLTRELEMASRDPGLRDRLQHLRRAQDSARSITPIPADLPDAIGPQTNGKKNNGLFRRIFG